jgi:hypothetical protein
MASKGLGGPSRHFPVAIWPPARISGTAIYSLAIKKFSMQQTEFRRRPVKMATPS